jgi:hypothetical protein
VIAVRINATRELDLRRGSRLVIFTDGLTDAQNAAGEEFGDDRLISCCRTIGPPLLLAGDMVVAQPNSSARGACREERFSEMDVVIS